MDMCVLGVDQILRLEGSRGHDGGGVGSGTCGHCFPLSLSLSLSLSLIFGREKRNGGYRYKS
jgi:hypothetical protein